MHKQFTYEISMEAPVSDIARCLTTLGWRIPFSEVLDQVRLTNRTGTIISASNIRMVKKLLVKNIFSGTSVVCNYEYSICLKKCPVPLSATH